MFDTASKFLAALEDLLRYVAPGFVGVALLLISFPTDNLPANLTAVGSSSLMLAGSVLIGVILNSCHVALLEDLFCWPVVFAYRHGARKFTEKVRKSSTCQMLRELEAQREFRRTSIDERAKHFQCRHDRFGASLTFLYCASYPGLAIAFYQCLMSLYVNRVALFTGLLLLFFAVACDVNYTRRDIWAAKRFHQSI